MYMKRFTNLALFLVIFSAIIITVGCTLYNINIGPVSKDSTLKQIEIKAGSSYLTIAPLLKQNNLIKSETFYKLYIKIFKPKSLEACTYNLSGNMGVKKIVSELEKGCKANPNAFNITFKEGLNMRAIAKTIANNTNNSEDDVFDLLKDTNYLNEIINEYWFLTDEIKNPKIYYSLEGYLFPDTYQFANKDAPVKEIFNTMLDEMGSKLEKYKTEIDKSGYTVHEILSLASIVELEAANSNDRAGVAGVFYNRLENNWSLGSDVTTYYAAKVDVSERDLYQTEIDDYNAYNTRNQLMAGKLPVGPICNPGMASIKATIEPTSHDYFYFVADKNKKTYFSKTEYQHNQIINQLKSEDLWYEYE